MELRLEGGTAGKLLIQAQQLEGTDVLGMVLQEPVDYVPGQPVRIPLLHTRLRQLGVGAHSFTWLWTVSNQQGKRLDAAEVRHRVWITLDRPGFPWNSEVEASRPTPATLDLACRWAAGSKDVKEALTHIAGEVRALGQARPGNQEPVLAYQGSPSFCDFWITRPDRTRRPVSAFFLDRFLRRLRREPGTLGKANCGDCATITSTFASLLGVSAQPLRLKGPSDFFPNFIRPIGVNDFMRVEEGVREHEVAVMSTPDGSLVWDPCYELDGDGTPNELPAQGVSPAELILDRGADKTDYISLLLDESDVRNRNLVFKQLRISRPFAGAEETSPSPDPQLPPIEDILPEGPTAPSSWHPGLPPGVTRLLDRLTGPAFSILQHRLQDRLDRAMLGWRRLLSRQMTEVPWALPDSLEASWELRGPASTSRLHLRLYRCQPGLDARDVLWQIRQQLDRPSLTQVHFEPGLGDVAVGDPRKLLFVAFGPFVAEIHLEAPLPMDLFQVGKLLVNALTGFISRLIP